MPCSATCTMSPFCDAMDQTAHAIADLHTCNAVPKHCRTKPGVVTLQAAHYLGSPLCWHVPARNPFLLLQWPRHFNVQTTKQRYWYCIFLCRTYVRPGCWIQTICCVHITLAGLPVASKASQSRYCAHKGNCFLPLRILCIPRFLPGNRALGSIPNRAAVSQSASSRPHRNARVSLRGASPGQRTPALKSFVCLILAPPGSPRVII